MRLKLTREWWVGERIGGGGFGQVFEASCQDTSVGPCAIKLVPKERGAGRELLFVDLDNARNVIPILETGETLDHWVLVMPRAERSLHQYMMEAGTPLDVQATISVLRDIATALSDLDGKVVHRDVKPQNILSLGGKWCLADFGISRYVEATTASDTWKDAFSRAYAAPERWRAERATTATDIYSFGVVAYELLTGALPFSGINAAEIREKHLHEKPGPIPNVPPLIAALVSECLYKSPGARPSPHNVLARLESGVERPKASAGLALLQVANMEEVVRKSENVRKESVGLSEGARRQELLNDALSSLHEIGSYLRSVIMENAPSATLFPSRQGGWSVQLNKAKLTWTPAERATVQPGRGSRLIQLDVIAFASIGVSIPIDTWGYLGRRHSLWFCDAVKPERYAWFETAFMWNPLVNKSETTEPFSVQPHEASAQQALGPGLGSHQLAWPFTCLSPSDLSDFISRWAEWFAQASQGKLRHPSTMPERPANWKR